MVGINEAWIIDRKVFVSPAIFQLLNDRGDPQTRMYITSQLVVKTATQQELNELEEKWIAREGQKQTWYVNTIEPEVWLDRLVP